jgi:hypothetical protein
VATLPAGSKPYGIAVDAVNVYWTNSGAGEVMQAKTDGSSPLKLATGEDSPRAVRVAGGFVYWVSYSIVGVLRKVPVGGGAVVDLTPAPASLDLVVGPSTIWWTREPDDIQSVPIAGDPDGGSVGLLTGNPLSNGIALDAANVYWVNRQDGYVKKADFDLTNDTALATGDVPFDIAVDATTVYWTEQGSSPGIGKVMKASKTDGSGSLKLAEGQMSPQGIAVDATSVYWANKDDGTIKKAPLGGGAVTTLAEGQKKPIKIAVDATSVYWANTTGDTIMKVAK